MKKLLYLLNFALYWRLKERSICGMESAGGSEEPFAYLMQ